MRGQFIWKRKDGSRLIIPNLVTDEGEDSFLKMITRGTTSDVSVGGNFYVGLTSGAFNGASDLAAVAANEPTNAGGYARAAITRDATGWPTISAVNGVTFARTATINFAASGADFSATFTRLFLCNASSGTSGKLFAVSAALATPLLITDGTDEDFQYELFLKG